MTYSRKLAVQLLAADEEDPKTSVITALQTCMEPRRGHKLLASAMQVGRKCYLHCASIGAYDAPIAISSCLRGKGIKLLKPCHGMDYDLHGVIHTRKKSIRPSKLYRSKVKVYITRENSAQYSLYLVNYSYYQSPY